jgi:hypothetical protein
MINVFANGVIFLFPAIFNPEELLSFATVSSLKNEMRRY